MKPTLTQRRLVLYVLNQDGNGLDDLNLDLVAAVLFDNADDVLQHVLFQKQTTQR